MSDADTTDLKQYIQATVSNIVAKATAGLATTEAMNERFSDLEVRMDQRFAIIDQRFEAVDQRLEDMDQRFNQRFNDIDRRFDDVDLKLVTIADAHAEFLQDHEQRITRLEHQAA